MSAFIITFFLRHQKVYKSDLDIPPPLMGPENHYSHFPHKLARKFLQEIQRHG